MVAKTLLVDDNGNSLCQTNDVSLGVMCKVSNRKTLSAKKCAFLQTFAINIEMIIVFKVTCFFMSC